MPDCYSPKSKFQLFHIPFNKDMSMAWRKACGSREDLDKWHNAMVCERHFQEGDFYVIPNSKTPGKRRLKRGAIPSMNLPDLLQLAECRRETMEAIAEKEKYKGVQQLLEDPKRPRPILLKPKKTIPFRDVGFENANIAIRAVAEDIEISSENVGDGAAGGEQEELPAFTFVDSNIKTEQSDFDREERVMAQVTSSSSKLSEGKNIVYQAAMDDATEKRLEEELSENKKVIMELKERVLELAEQKKKLHADNAAKRCSIGRKKNKKTKLNAQDREGILRDVLGKHFSKAQIRCLMKGDWQMGKNWEEKDYKLALTIFTISKRCYHYIRNHHILPLPSYTCLKRHVTEDTPIKREVEAFLQSESQCNCGQENCQHNLAFPLSTDLVNAPGGSSSANVKKEPSKEVQLAVMNLLEEDGMDEDDTGEEDDEGDDDDDDDDAAADRVEMHADMQGVQYIQYTE